MTRLTGMRMRRGVGAMVGEGGRSGAKTLGVGVEIPQRTTTSFVASVLA